MNTAAFDIKTIIEANRSDLIFGTNLFIAFEPEAPSNCVTLFDVVGDVVSGVNFSKQQDEGIVQVRVRDVSYHTGITLAFELAEIFKAWRGKVNGRHYSIIKAGTIPMLQDWDANSRAKFVVTMNFMREV